MARAPVSGTNTTYGLGARNDLVPCVSPVATVIACTYSHWITAIGPVYNVEDVVGVVWLVV